MKTIFLPYTTFQIASLIRALISDECWEGELYLLYGFGTLKSLEGNIYLKKLIVEPKFKNKTRIINLKSLNGLLRLIALMIGRYRFVSGNLRRLPSLFLAKYAAEIFAIDDGVGSSISGGYFDRDFLEKSKFKKFLIKLHLINSYESVYDRVINHLTLFSKSVYLKNKKIKLHNLFQEEKKLNTNTGKITIYISSSLSIMGLVLYLEKMRAIIDAQEECDQIYFAAHPEDSMKSIDKILKEFKLKKLNTNGLLLEDYVLWLADSGMEVKLIGEENTSSVLLGLENHCGVSVNVWNYHEVV